MLLKIAVTEGRRPGSSSSAVVVSPIGKLRPSTSNRPSPRTVRWPWRWAAAMAAHSSGERSRSTASNGWPTSPAAFTPSSSSAAGLAYSRLPSPSTVTIPLLILRRMSLASRRRRVTSCCSTSCSAPTALTRLASHPIATATVRNTPICSAIVTDSWMGCHQEMSAR